MLVTSNNMKLLYLLKSIKCTYVNVCNCLINSNETHVCTITLFEIFIRLHIYDIPFVLVSITFSSVENFTLLPKTLTCFPPDLRILLLHKYS